MPRHIAPGCTARRAQQAQAVEQHLPHQQQQVAGMVHAMEHQHAQAVYLVDQAPGFWRGRRGAVACHPLQHGTLPFVQRQPLRPGTAPVVPEQLRAHVVEPLQTTQIPPQWRPRRQVVELGLQHPPLRARSELPQRPSARAAARTALRACRCRQGAVCCRTWRGVAVPGPATTTLWISAAQACVRWSIIKNAFQRNTGLR